MSNIIVKVIPDTCPENPRQDACGYGTMACWHRNYKLGDVQPKESPEEWLAENAPKGSVVLPLYLYDHSGLSMGVGAPICAWDSGRVGYIVLTPDQIRECRMVKRITAKVRAQAEKDLRAQVAVYSAYLEGDAWGFTIEKETPCECCERTSSEQEDSCFGFFGDDALPAMLANIAPEHVEALKVAWEKRFDRQ